MWLDAQAKKLCLNLEMNRMSHGGLCSARPAQERFRHSEDKGFDYENGKSEFPGKGRLD
jgi:hypothetical protein